jgi:hypothetical protein
VIAEALAQRASILASLNRRRRCRAGIREAREHLARVPDPAFRAACEVTFARIRSDLKRRRDPAAADAATQAIQIVATRAIASSRAIEPAIGEGQYRMGTDRACARGA